MNKHKLLVLVATAGLLGGCAATLTPTGEIYTEALLPVDTTVVVESYPLVAYGPRPHYQPAPAPRPHRGSLRPGPHFAPSYGPRHGHHRPVHYYGAPGQHRSPGQHRAPGIRGPRTPNEPGSHFKTGHRPQGPQARGGQHKPSGSAGRPQGSRPAQPGTHGPNSHGPRR